IRLKHPILRRRQAVCRAVERELLSVIGIDNCRANSLTGTVLLNYSPRELRRTQIVEILDSALNHVVAPAEPDKPDVTFPLCAASVPLAALAQFAVPALLPVSAALFV